MMRIVNLILSEICVLTVIGVLNNSALSLFVPIQILYFLTAIPVALLLTGRNPFDIRLFFVLISLMSVKIASDSKVFYGFLDALYYMGFRDFAMQMRSIFQFYSSSVLKELMIVVILFVLSQISWVAYKKSVELRKRGLRFDVYTPVALSAIFLLAIYYFYPAFILNMSLENNLITGILGITLIVIAISIAR